MDDSQVDIDLVSRFVNRETSQEEERLILEWLERSHENRKQFADLMLNVSLRSMLVDPERERCEEEMLDLLRLRIDADSSVEESRLRRRRWILPFVAFAAACVALFLIFTPFSSIRRDNTSEERYQFSFTNTKQIVASVTLGDNTKVMLKPGAQVEYDVTGFGDRRILKLVGEAFFEVAPDSLRPFTVKTGNIGVEVLGTAFSVRACDSSPESEVVLERGSVRILSPEGYPLVTISPDQRAVFNVSDGGLRVESINAVPYIAENYNLITLSNASIAEIVASIEQSFGVHLVIDGNTDKSGKYFFSYSVTDSVEDILSILEFISGQRFEIHSSTLN